MVRLAKGQPSVVPPIINYFSVNWAVVFIPKVDYVFISDRYKIFKALASSAVRDLDFFTAVIHKVPRNLATTTTTLRDATVSTFCSCSNAEGLDGSLTSTSSAVSSLYSAPIGRNGATKRAVLHFAAVSRLIGVIKRVCTNYHYLAVASAIVFGLVDGRAAESRP